MAPLPPFHLAVEVKDLATSREFYGGLLGCPEGRSAESWVDFNFFGHQLVCHVVSASPAESEPENSNPIPGQPVDGHHVPVPHFGVVLEMDQWQALADKFTAAGIQFIIAPYIRFAGEPGEQATMFLYDPSGNALEFKAFADIPGQLFAK